MDLQHAVALSTLPGISRPRAAATYKQLREQAGDARLPRRRALRLRRAATGGGARGAGGRRPSAARPRRGSGVAPLPWCDRGVSAAPARDPRSAARAVGARQPGRRSRRRGRHRRVPRSNAIRAGRGGATRTRSRGARGITVVSGPGARRAMARRTGLPRGGRHHGRGARLRLRRRLSAEHEGLLVADRRTLAARWQASSGPARRRCRSTFRCATASSAGFSLAVVVVEASERSGSLITARCALEQGRDVMAVPGNVLGGRNRGSHALLQGRRKDRRDCGRYSGRAGVGPASARPWSRLINS